MECWREELRLRRVEREVGGKLIVVEARLAPKAQGR